MNRTIPAAPGTTGHRSVETETELAVLELWPDGRVRQANALARTLFDAEVLTTAGRSGPGRLFTTAAGSGDFELPVADGSPVRVHAAWRRLPDAGIEVFLVRLPAVDARTGLPLRAQLEARLDTALTRARPESGHCAVLALELILFPHTAEDDPARADALWLAIVRRLQSVLKPGYLLGRSAEHRFSVVLCEVASAVHAQYVAMQLCAAFVQPVGTEHDTVTVSLRIGVAVHPDHATDAAGLFGQAATALAAIAERPGSGPTLIAEGRAGAAPSARAHGPRRNPLLRALQRDEVVLLHAPELACAGGPVLGCDAQLHWRKPGLGPIDAVSGTADAGVQTRLAVHLLRASTGAGKRLRAAGLNGVSIGFELAPVLFWRHDLFDLLSMTLAEARMPADSFVLQLRGSVLVQDPDPAVRRRAGERLHELRAAGFRLALTGFGYGPGLPPGLLAELPFDRLTLHPRVIAGVAVHAANRAIVARSLAFAHALGWRAIATGVETGPQYLALTELGCDAQQGGALARPLPFTEFEAFLRAHPPAAGVAPAGRPGLASGVPYP